MSSFATTLPVNLDDLKKLLPEGSHVEGVVWNPDRCEVELRWSNSNLVTPFTFHQPYSVKELTAKTLPENTKVRPPAPKPAPETAQTDGVPVPTAKKKSVAKNKAAAAKQ